MLFGVSKGLEGFIRFKGLGFRYRVFKGLGLKGA